MFTPHWAGLVGFMVFSHQGSGFQSYSLLGVRIGCMCTPCWGSGFTLVTTRWVIDNTKRSKNYQGKAKGKLKIKKKQLGFRFTPFRVTPCWGCMLTLHLAREVV